MSRTNWDEALKYVSPLDHFKDVYGTDRTEEVILQLTKAGGTLAISQDKLHMSEYSFEYLQSLFQKWYSEKLNWLAESGKLSG